MLPCNCKQMPHAGSWAAPPKDGRHRHLDGEQLAAREAASVVVDTGMVAAAVAGASLLAWWWVAFHPSNSRLWMVPVGLVLACTPAVVCLTLFCSAEMSVPSGGGGKGAGSGAKAATLSAVVVEK